jgi:hypothetical protein
LAGSPLIPRTPLIGRQAGIAAARWPGASVELQQLYELQFRWRWLQLVPPEHHTEQERMWLEEGVKVFGHPPEPFFLSWRTPSSPLVVSGEASESQRHPLQAAWEDGGARVLAVGFRETEGWGSGIADLVRRDPEKLLELAPHIGPEDGERIASFLSGYESVLEREPEKPFSWEPLLELVERVVERASELPQTVTATARLLRTGITSNSKGLSQDLLDRAMTAMAKAVDALVQPVDGDSRLSESMDQLNDPAGAAANAFMLSLWRWLELLTDTPRIPEAAQPWITAALDKGCTLAGRGVLIQGADCCWRYLDLFPVAWCSPQPRPDGAGGPVNSSGCVCDPGQLRIIPPTEVPLVYDDTTRFGEIYFQGLDCKWYRLPCPAICREMA